MDDLQTFHSNVFGDITVILFEAEAYFIGVEVANKLGYTNPNKAVTMHVDPEDRKILDFKSFSHFGKSLWRDNDYSNKTLINESGVYSLVFGSKLPEAKRFKHWVTAEVLPTIRKHGAYMTENVIQKALASPDFLIQLATQLKESQEKTEQLQIEVKQQSQHIAQQNVAISYMKPKADYCDRVLACKEAVSITVIAKDYGWSAIKMNRFLQDHRVQFRRGNQWLLYQKYAKFGYTVTRTNVTTDRMGVEHTEVWTYWTQKGRLFIYEFLKERGILPLYEQPVLPLPDVPQYQPPGKKEVDE